MSVLYYSARCEHCKRLFAEFQLQPNNTGLTLVDVDNSQEALPPYLRVVPTLVLGETNEKYEGKDVFGALRARLAQQQQTPPNNPVVEPYAFSCNNVTNKGFSFINTDHPVYSEQANYAFFT